MSETSLVMPEDPQAIGEPSRTIRVALRESGTPPRPYKKRGFFKKILGFLGYQLRERTHVDSGTELVLYSAPSCSKH